MSAATAARSDTHFTHNGEPAERNDFLALQRLLGKFKQRKRQQRVEPNRKSSEAQRRSGESRSNRPGVDSAAGAHRQPVRPCGYPDEQTQSVADVLFNETLEHC